MRPFFDISPLAPPIHLALLFLSSVTGESQPFACWLAVILCSRSYFCLSRKTNGFVVLYSYLQQFTSASTTHPSSPNFPSSTHPSVTQHGPLSILDPHPQGCGAGTSTTVAPSRTPSPSACPSATAASPTRATTPSATSASPVPSPAGGRFCYEGISWATLDPIGMQLCFCCTTGEATHNTPTVKAKGTSIIL